MRMNLSNTTSPGPGQLPAYGERAVLVYLEADAELAIVAVHLLWRVALC